MWYWQSLAPVLRQWVAAARYPDPWSRSGPAKRLHGAKPPTHPTAHLGVHHIAPISLCNGFVAQSLRTPGRGVFHARHFTLRILGGVEYHRTHIADGKSGFITFLNANPRDVTGQPLRGQRIDDGRWSPTLAFPEGLKFLA